jgi:xanthine dehydrogenase accessory factor
MKIGDIDPRAAREHCFTISDKSLAIAGGVLEAVLYLLRGQRRAFAHSASVR